MINRRSFIASLFVAPAIVKIDNIMKILPPPRVALVEPLPGWVILNGARLSKAEFPDLYSIAFSSGWAKKDEFSTEFTLPDRVNLRFKMSDGRTRLPMIRARENMDSNGFALGNVREFVTRNANKLLEGKEIVKTKGPFFYTGYSTVEV